MSGTAYCHCRAIVYIIVAAAKGAPPVNEVSTLSPKTKEEFQELSDRLIELISRHQEKPLYSMFVEMHVKALAAPLNDVNTRKAASALTTLANEKQKEQRDKASGKKKPKAAAKPGLVGAKATGRYVHFCLVLSQEAHLFAYLGWTSAHITRRWMISATTISCKFVDVHVPRDVCRL